MLMFTWQTAVKSTPDIAMPGIHPGSNSTAFTDIQMALTSEDTVPTISTPLGDLPLPAVERGADDNSSQPIDPWADRPDFSTPGPGETVVIPEEQLVLSEDLVEARTAYTAQQDRERDGRAWIPHAVRKIPS